MAIKKIERSASEVFLEQAIRDGRATLQELAIGVIKADSKYQSRVAIDPEHVKHLASLMDLEIELRPIVVFRDPKTKVMRTADGFHRLRAHRSRRMESIRAFVIDGGEDELILYSVSANLENSKPTSRDDRKKAAMMLLENETTRKLSINEIAKRCGLNRTSVTNYRNEYFTARGLTLPSHVECEWQGKKTIRAAKLTKVMEPRYYVQPGYSGSGKASAYFMHRSKRVYLGQDSQGARQKFDELKKDALEFESAIDQGRATLESNGRIVDWLNRREVSAKVAGIGRQLVSGIQLPGYACVALLSFDARSLFEAVGRIHLLRRTMLTDGVGVRMVVLCYISEEEPRYLIDVAISDGIEFMTPEELVEEVKSIPPASDPPA